MPTLTFLQLNQEKREKIEKSAIKEFSTRLYQDASLNQIIKDAEISRGSFYMYFEDKKDLYLHLLDKYLSLFDIKIKDSLETNDNDLIGGFRSFFRSFHSNIINMDDYLFIANIFKNRNYFIENKLLSKKPNRDLVTFIYKNINKEKLNITKEEDIIRLIHIILLLSMNYLTSIVYNPKEKDLIEKEYDMELSLLKSAFYKEEEK